MLGLATFLHLKTLHKTRPYALIVAQVAKCCGLRLLANCAPTYNAVISQLFINSESLSTFAFRHSLMHSAT
jgi:hypothetical protein